MRNEAFVVGRKGGKAMSRVAAILLLAACGAKQPADGQEPGASVAFERILRASHSGVDEALAEVVRDEAMWQELWARIHRRVDPRPPAPSVDFARQMVIAVASGTRPSGGFGLTVTGVSVAGDELDVEVLETCPGPDAMVTAALTQPVEVVRLERLELEPRFRRARAPACE